MDKFGKISLVLGLLAMLSVSAYPQTVTSGALSLVNLKTNPPIIVAGSNVTFSFQLYNSYNQQLQYVNLQLVGSYPIFNVSPSNSTLLGTVGQGIYSGVGLNLNYLGSTLQYTVRIPKDTPSGSYTIDAVANYQTSATLTTGSSSTTETLNQEETMPITFYVHGLPQMQISGTAQSIIPGDEFQLQADILNTGYGAARNVTVTFMGDSNFTVVGSRTFKLGTIQNGASGAQTVTYQASENVGDRTYTVPALITYQSDTNANYSVTENITLNPVINTPNVYVTLLSAQPQALYNGYNQTLQLSIQNIGTGTAKNVSVTLLSRNGTNVLGSVNSFFIPQLAPDQSVTESILVGSGNTTGTSPGITAQISYRSADYSKGFANSEPLSLAVAPAAQFTVVGVSGPSLGAGATNIPVIFQVKNTGSMTAQQVQLNFQSAYPITPIQGSAYLPSLAPGQSMNVSFLVSIDQSAVNGNYPVTVYEQWKQPNGAVNQQYSGSANYYVQIGGGGSGLAGDAELVIVIAIIAVVAYRMRGRFMKAGHKEKEKTARK
ncbi:MAG: COG1361 S-layer family protein [Candidatus Micrarchaeota archaeon]|nr:COG1361 S-layer family protein [Candidatus Micrarchaeota archaeon]